MGAQGTSINELCGMRGALGGLLLINTVIVHILTNHVLIVN